MPELKTTGILRIYLQEQIKLLQDCIALNEKAQEDNTTQDFKPGVEFFRGKVEAFQFVKKSMEQYLKVLENE